MPDSSESAPQPLMREAPFGRVMTAMVTPFTEGGKNIDLRAAQNLARYLVATGSDGLVVAGTTGESPTISHEEQHELFWAVREAVSVKILAGTGSNNPKEAVDLTEWVTQHQVADGCLVVSPYYSKPPPSGIYDYYRQVAESTELPVVMYDIAARTGQPIPPDIMLRLAQDFENIKGLKDAGGIPAQTKALMDNLELPSDFVVYSGDDGRNLELARLGSVGAISVASHWAAREMGAMYDAVNSGNDALADAIDNALKSSYTFESSKEAGNPIPATAMMRTILGGKAIGYCRSPMVIDPADEVRLERAAYKTRADLYEKFAEAIAS